MSANRETTGIVFNIQKYSVNDGPGIRTTVFLKGCPLRCRWCSNPESQQIQPELLWNGKTCLHCHHCEEICPQKAVRFIDDRIIIDKRQCIMCGNCISECPSHTLQAAGERKTVAEVMEAIVQDIPFYQESGGGMTISGGEVFLQADFAKELLTAAKEEGVHTCIETTGCCSGELFSQMLQHVDHLLIDLKHYDSQMHQQFTGVSNDIIVQNIKAAIASGISMLIRIPVIPGFNDSLQDAESFSKLLKLIGADKCQLLPFHQFGETKYSQLGRKYDYEDTDALHREQLEDYRNIFIVNGIDAFF